MANGRGVFNHNFLLNIVPTLFQPQTKQNARSNKPMHGLERSCPWIVILVVVKRKRAFSMIDSVEIIPQSHQLSFQCQDTL